MRTALRALLATILVTACAAGAWTRTGPATAPAPKHRVVMEYLAKYEQLRTGTAAFNQGFSQGLGTGRMAGKWDEPPYGDTGYGFSHGGDVDSAIASAQALANETGQEVDVDIN